ncbi:MAG: N(4)-(beta-N-acetylglucosaminyl)-L-asparaginase [Acidobacteriota bacterium]|nr:N(4)-(beta-N-acetylglucosaminyl)-L-asparaginase [Acidobacteriota bacterium]
MKKKAPWTGRNLSRRQFVQAGAAGAAALGAAASGAPAIQTSGPKPVVIASGNGNRYKNGGDEVVVERAFRLMTEGKDILESLIEGVKITELDPEDASVGYGGRPNDDGVVQLDSCCMHGPNRRAGGVAGIEGVRTPASVAYQVLQVTDHHLLVGKGAQDFARNLGFKIEDDLNTPRSREMWLEWKRRIDPGHYLDPKKRAAAGHAAGLSMVRDGLIDEEEYYGTINCDGLNTNGDLAGVTTTSGLAWKIPGRVGDSPILGAGLYVDNAVGAAGSTGRGEANLYGLCSFLIVEEMRRGAHPKDAAMTALSRVKDNTVEKRLLNSRGLPAFGLSFYVVNKAGVHAGVSMYTSARSSYAVCDENGPQSLPMEPFLEGSASD